MNIDDLRAAQAHFESRRQHQQAHYRKYEMLRREFVKLFTVDRLKRLRKEDYVEGKVVNGKVDDHTFCYWVEWKTESLGRMQGARSDKFGIYMEKKTQKYKYIKRFSSADEAFQHTKEQIIRLVEIGRTANPDDLHAIELSPMFKGKILFLYYPHKYLNIFSSGHVGFFIRRIGLDSSEKWLLHQRHSIVEWKNQDKIMVNWSMFEFSDFLYSELGWPPKRGQIPTDLKDYIEPEDEYPAVDETTPEFLSLAIVDTSPPNDAETNRSTVIKRSIDFEKQNRRQRRLGELGEQIVLKAERTFLSGNGHPDLAKKVKQISLGDPSAGYDILTYELDGSEKHVEVKTTGSPPSSEVSFFLTANELQQSKELSNYYLYIVFDARSKKPKIWRLANPANLEGRALHLVPLSFRCSIFTN